MCDNIILYPAPLVLPRASRFDQLLALTERLARATETHTPHDQAQLDLCVDSLNTFLTTDAALKTLPRRDRNCPFHLPTAAMAPSVASSAPIVPVTQSARHLPSSDIGADLIGWTFQEHSLGYCKVLHTDNYLDSDSILWNTLAYSSTKAKDIAVSKVSEVRK